MILSWILEPRGFLGIQSAFSVIYYFAPPCCSLPLSLLPKAVKRRVHALKRLQLQCAHIEAKFYEEVHELERKYAALYQPLFDKVTTNLPPPPAH